MRLIAGGWAAATLTGGRGASNRQAKSELVWQPHFPSWREAHFVGCPEPLMLGPNSKWLETIDDWTAEGAAFSTAMAAAAACARQRADEARRDHPLPPDPQSEARGGVEPLMGKA